MKQYYSIKAGDPDILLTWVGDLHETFGETRSRPAVYRHSAHAALFGNLRRTGGFLTMPSTPRLLVRAGDASSQPCEQLETPQVRGLVKRRGGQSNWSPRASLGDNILANKREQLPSP